MQFLTEFTTWVTDFVAKNEFASGGLLVGIAGVALAYARSLPSRVFAWAWRRATIEVEVTNNSDLFDAVEFWLGKNGLLDKTRLFRVNFRPTPPRINDNDDRPSAMSLAPSRKIDPEQSIEFSAGTGYHYFFFDRRLVILRRVREESKKSNYSSQDSERFEISFVTRRRDRIHRFFVAALNSCQPPDAQLVRVYTAYCDSWRLSSTPRARSPESIVLADDIFHALRSDATSFFARSEWYYEMGIPYRRGYLLTGPPGNGKTSTILCLAGVLDAPVCVLDVGAPSMSDDRLRDLMSAAPLGAFFILEDVDAIFHGRSRPKHESAADGESVSTGGGVTFSGLLNALDGAATPDGRIVFMTTNHPEKLDPALIRPGRIDRRFEFKNACPEQARRMFLRFFPGMWGEAEAFGLQNEGKSMASIQNKLLEAGEDWEAALQTARPG